MKMMKTAALAVMLGCLSACSSAGNASLKSVTAADVDRSIRDGVTTSAQLRQLYGEPSETSFENGNELWVYVYSATRQDGLSMVQDVVGLGVLGTRDNAKSNILKVTLHKGIVVHHSFTTSQNTGGSGLRQ
ncbi:lipoprotein [Gluconobacter frateurii M-2]|nr:lipoprotein [Gluconobacter frateurii M-2]